MVWDMIFTRMVLDQTINNASYSFTHNFFVGCKKIPYNLRNNVIFRYFSSFTNVILKYSISNDPNLIDTQFSINTPKTHFFLITSFKQE